MIIGDRIRLLRETKNFPKATSKSARDFFAATFRGSKMAIPFRPSKRSRNWRGPWKFHSTSYFTTAKSHPSCLICRSAKAQTILHGVAPGKKPASWDGFADYWAVERSDAVSCSIWLRKWPIGFLIAIAFGSRRLALFRIFSVNPFGVILGGFTGFLVILLPLDRARRFRADIVDDPVYSRDFVDDARKSAPALAVAAASSPPSSRLAIHHAYGDRVTP